MNVSRCLVRSLAVFCLLTTIASSALAQAAKEFEPTVGQEGKDVIWVPTAQALVDKMLDMAKVTPNDYVIDLGSGDGRTVITAAKRGAKTLGIEYNPDMVELSKRNAAAAGVAERVTFAVRDAAYPGLAGGFDLVTAFETIHDMAQPVEALRKMRGLVADGGAVMIADERVGETFTAPGDDVERLNYGFSVLHCLAVGLAESPSAGTGTVMRPPTLRRYAREAGFSAVEIAPIEHDFWRFYLLRP